MIKYFLESKPSSFLIWDEKSQDVVYQQQVIMLSENLSLVYKKGQEEKVDSEIAVNFRTSCPMFVAEILYNANKNPIKEGLFSALIHGINTKNGKRKILE